MSIKKISVIGLGLMGTPIATLLMRAGYQVTGFDIIKKQMSNLVPLGFRAVKSPKEAAKGADLIMLSLPTWNAVLDVVERKDGVVEGAQRGQIVLDTSTSPPWESMALGARLTRKGIEWMDGPISGSFLEETRLVAAGSPAGVASGPTGVASGPAGVASGPASPVSGPAGAAAESPVSGGGAP